MTRELDIEHGIKLTIEGELGKGGFSVLAGFFDEAVRHFEEMRDVAKRPMNGDPFRRRFRTGCGREVSVELSRPVPLAVARWVEAAARGYSSADGLERIVAQFSGFRSFVQVEKGDLIEAFKDRIDSDIEYARKAGLDESGMPRDRTPVESMAAN